MEQTPGISRKKLPTFQLISVSCEFINPIQLRAKTTFVQLEYVEHYALHTCFSSTHNVQTLGQTGIANLHCANMYLNILTTRASFQGNAL